MSESHEAAPVSTDQEAVETNVTPQPGTSDSFTDSPPQPTDELYGRYEQMQADYTRKTQSLAEQRREIEAHREAAESWKRLQEDPDFHRQTLEAFGYELPEDEPAYEEPDQGYGSDPRVEALMQAELERQARDQELQTQADELAVEGHIQELAQQAGVKLTPKQASLLVADAASVDPQPHRTEAIFNEYLDDLRAMQGDWEKNWLASKQGVPHVSPGGQPGSSRPDLSDTQTRREHMAAIMDADSAE